MFASGLTACSNGQDDFTSGLSEDPCNNNYPACNTEVGCILTDLSYTSGTFPGAGQFLVTLTGPSTVEVHFFLLDPTSAGTNTFITWFESGCTSNFQTEVTGKDFIGEAEAANGEFVRSQQLTAVGDHLITYQSDITSDYLVKVVITPVDSTM